ncbi:hypothetical protein ASN18_0621 [Candidatus Magnetominusculus xianensis]|uniref:DUF58 domain-containing protein n=2 Tax=Candidatus Magnetominusculus xianensis TaxID=1748249 RepID=A0ABR5SI53_9BACT|nr:hypothetical protein ASN18_0621 [Candidatus Magnetominusculus xianensis]
MLGFMGVSGIFGKRNLSKIEVSTESPPEIYAGVEFPLKITLTNNRGFLPGFLLSVTADGTVVMFPFTDTKTAQYKYIPFTFPTRGVHLVRDIYICSVFPFNFFMRCTPVSCSKEFVVFPAPKKCTLSGADGRSMRSGGEGASDRTGFDSDIVSIRNYIQGDPLKYISWKATARSGKLKTKELSSMSFDPVLIDFDNTTGIADREERISCITYTIVTLIKRNIPVGLKIGEKVYPPGTSHASRATLLNALALLPPEN